MASTYLTRTQGTPTSDDIGTYSFWIKRGTLDKINEYLVQNYIDGSNYGYLRFKGDNQFQHYSSGGGDWQRRTNRLFRDTNAWYHIVLRIDTTQSTASDRVRLYVNGVQETSFSTETNASQNVNNKLFASGGTLRIGYVSSGTATYFDGCLSHLHYCDGQSYAPTEFGETDSTTGEWKINTTPNVTYGNNGFFIFKDGTNLSGSTVQDQSGNGNNFTVGGGTLTKTEDNPSNVFATMNALQYSPSTEFSNGNLTVKQNAGTGAHRRFTATLGALSGKYYWEVKLISSITDGCTIGIVDGVNGDYSTFLGQNSNEWGYNLAGDIYHNASAYQSGLPTYTNGNIINIALDLDNNYIYFGKNGTWINSGVPTSGATGTGGYAITDNIIYHPAISLFVNTATASFNFGNGYFGTTAVSSAGTNASGIGIFEYDVPTGYTALSTKGLNL